MQTKNNGIGFVGLGGITNVHRAGYRLAGLPVVAGFDVAEKAREAFAKEEPNAKVYDSLAALLENPNVAVIDLATPHHREARVPVIERITRTRKPVFIQKPMAMCYADAVEMVEALERTGTIGMVNQNMCFTPGGMALPPRVVDEKILGEPYLAHMELRTCFDCRPDHWYGKDERWWTIGLTVHHLALLQLLFGPPERVYALIGKDAAQAGVTHDGFGHLILSYRSGLQVTMLSTGTYYGKNTKPHGAEELWVQGPLGVVDWQPEGGFTITLRANKDLPDETKRRQFVATPGKWSPDAFGMGMSHFQQALAARAEPLCSVQDNLYVMAVMEAAYQSGKRRDLVSLAEVMGKRYDANYGPGWRHGLRSWEKPSLAASSAAQQ